MADLKNYTTARNTQFEVLTPEGFKDFKGMFKGENCKRILLKFSSNKFLSCTPKHKICINKKKFKYAKDIKIGEKVYGDYILLDKQQQESSDLVYEFLEVNDTHTYFVNGILSRQCLILDELAFIDNHMVTEFWRSVYPIISSSQKSKIFIASTPNGTDNLFYELYKGGEKGGNGWTCERVDWWEVPGRDDKWKENTIKSLGSAEAFAQEFGNEFLKTGESAVDEELFIKLKEDIKEPQFVFDEGHYLVWEPPSNDKLYVAGVDVSEGVGQAATVMQIFDITDLKNIEQVAIYHNNAINPIQFTQKCLEILQNWGNPPACIERNNCGAQVVDQLKLQHSYPNIVSYGPKVGDKTFNRHGILAHTNTKYKGVINMRYYLNELRAVKIRDRFTLNELKGFVRYPNGTWAASPGSDNWDDRVMSLMWALIVLENDVVEKYFEVIQKDDNERPLLIKSLDYGIRDFIDPTQTLINLKTKSDLELPILISGSDNKTHRDEEIESLRGEGWQMPGEPYESGWKVLNNF